MSGQSVVNINIDGLAALEGRLAEFDEELLMTVSQRLRAVALTMVGLIKYRSPVDHGFYRNRWALSGVEEDSAMVRAVIANNMVYAEPVTYGSVAGQRPWPNAGPKTVRQGNRVYSRLAEGGVIDPHIEGWVRTVTDEIRDGLIEGLGG